MDSGQAIGSGRRTNEGEDRQVEVRVVEDEADEADEDGEEGVEDAQDNVDDSELRK